VKTRPTPPLTAAQREALEARFALRLSARLEEGAQAVPHDVTERLRVAREQAIRAAREARTSAAVAPITVLTPVAVGAGVAGLSGAGGPSGAQMQTGTGLLGNWSTSQPSRTSSRRRPLEDGPTAWGWRLAAFLPVIALVAGLWGIQRYAKHEQVEAAADVDMQLLTDDLPPDAYADPGFEEFLNRDAGPTVRAIEDAPPEADGDLVTTDTQADLVEPESAPATSTP
jgi:hypothetical protein